MVATLCLLAVGAGFLVADEGRVKGKQVEASDWPQLRGPNGTGIAADANPPLKWTASDGVKWKTPLPGPGSSPPNTRDDRTDDRHLVRIVGDPRENPQLRRALTRDCLVREVLTAIRLGR